MTGLFCSLLASVILLASIALGDPIEKCVPRNATYKVGDHQQCDKYYECNPSGKLTDRECDDGFVFSLTYAHCNYPHVVNCSNRQLLQKSPSNNPQCPRMNGFYAFPAEISCQKFHHCLEGEAYEKTCPEGIIFDDTKGACVHPDLAGRHECSASEVLHFKCPNSESRFTKLKFGNHDRLPHTSDCRKFFICTQDGQPRIGGCPVGKLFNAKTGTCLQAKTVEKNQPQCKDYYGKKSNAPKLDGDEDEAEEEEETNGGTHQSDAESLKSDDVQDVKTVQQAANSKKPTNKLNSN